MLLSNDYFVWWERLVADLNTSICADPGRKAIVSCNSLLADWSMLL